MPHSHDAAPIRPVRRPFPTATLVASRPEARYRKTPKRSEPPYYRFLDKLRKELP